MPFFEGGKAAVRLDFFTTVDEGLINRIQDGPLFIIQGPVVHKRLWKQGKVFENLFVEKIFRMELSQGDQVRVPCE